MWGTTTTDGVTPSTVGYFTTTLSLPAATDADSFNDALTTLLRSAFDNGVDVEGGWDCATDGQTSDWDAVIVEVVGESDSVDVTDEG